MHDRILAVVEHKGECMATGGASGGLAVMARRGMQGNWRTTRGKHSGWSA